VHLLAVLVLIVPKIGSASDLAIKIPNPTTEEWYLRGVNETVDAFHTILQKIAADYGRTVRLANIDLDTGNRVKRGDYPLADETYAELLARITSKPSRTIPADLKRNIIDYYAGLVPSNAAEQRLSAQLNVLKGMKTGDGLYPDSPDAGSGQSAGKSRQ
jgi:hypothetical protein